MAPNQFFLQDVMKMYPFIQIEHTISNIKTHFRSDIEINMTKQQNKNRFLDTDSQLTDIEINMTKQQNTDQF